MTMRWDPAQYAKYSDERSRPFFDLVARVAAESPRRVVDIGCGPGTLTATLADRWPLAAVDGVDSSPEMIERARPLATDRLRFHVEDAARWAKPADTDVIVSNAALQWVPGHVALLRSWASTLPSAGWIAVQVPGNFGSPSHVVMRELAASGPWSQRLTGVLDHHDSVATPERYAGLLADCGLSVDVWETTYLHILDGDDPVLEWMRGTGLRPVLAALPADQAAEFERSYAARLRAAYPATKHGTVFPFRRVFAVAHRS